MENSRLHKIECTHMVELRESERLKVTALNLFHPTASPLFEKVGFFIIATESLEGEGTLGASSPLSQKDSSLARPGIFIGWAGEGEGFRPALKKKTNFLESDLRHLSFI